MRRIRSRIRVGKGATKRIASQGKPISGTYAGGSGLKVPPALRNKLVAALAKAAAQPSKAELQTGWFYSLDLEPAENLGAELSLIGSEPPGKAVTHPDYKPQVLTAAAPNAEGGWTLMPVTNCVMGDGKSDLALLRVDKLPLKPVTFHESNDKVSSDVSILGFERGADILKAGMKSENGSIKPSEEQSLVFQTTATVDAGNRGGACIDSSWRVVGINWQRSSEMGSRGECYSLSGIRDWMHSNAPTISLNTTSAESPKEQREYLRKSVAPILAWHKNQNSPNMDFGVLRDEWCIACRGKSIVPCRTCSGVRAIQPGTTKVQAAFNPINGTANYLDVPTKKRATLAMAGVR